MSRSHEQNNRCPVALTSEVRPQRRRVYFFRVPKVKVDGHAAISWRLALAIIFPFKLFACVCVCYCAPCSAFLIAAKEQKWRHCVSSE